MSGFELLGYLGQGLFLTRTLWQWVASERAGRTVVPSGYWGTSLLAAGFVLTYAVSDRNLVFVLGVLPGGVVAARNLWIRRPTPGAWLAPWAVTLSFLIVWSALAQPAVGPPAWAAVGLLGSLLWSGRHVLQWWVSERTGASTLPLPYWLMALAGSTLLLSYAIALGKPVMILGYGFNSVPALRNLLLHRVHYPASS